MTVPSNLRIIQRQVFKRKHHKLEFLVPWWDLQLGISINQFLSIFASSNSDFRLDLLLIFYTYYTFGVKNLLQKTHFVCDFCRHRAFSFLFKEGEYEEINDSQTVESHCFPHHFVESKEKMGLAPAAIVLSRGESHDSSIALKSLDYNRQMRSQSPAIGNYKYSNNCILVFACVNYKVFTCVILVELAARKGKHIVSKENENPDYATNPYQAIVVARDSLKQREESQKMQAEIQKLNEEVSDTRRRNEEEKLTIQDLEFELIKRRRRAEKCRRLAEAQSSYRTMLEKMIRDAMHQ